MLGRVRISLFDPTGKRSIESKLRCAPSRSLRSCIACSSSGCRTVHGRLTAQPQFGAKEAGRPRYFPGGLPKPDFVLDQPRYKNACFILAGQYFGCGSSRETAVWSLQEAGIRCVIAPSFSDIFQDNAFQNGFLPLKLPMEDIERIAAALERSNASEMTIDLENRQVRVPGLEPVAFELADERRMPLLEGLDQLGFMMRCEANIAAFEQKDEQNRPWAYPK